MSITAVHPTTYTPSAPSAVRKWLLIGLMLAIAALIAIIGVGSSSPAQANPVTDLVCATPSLSDSDLAVTTNALAISEPQGGFFPTTPTGRIDQGLDVLNAPWGTSSHTAYEWYGMSGLNWTMWRGSGIGPTADVQPDCLGIGTWMTTMPANMAFWLVKSITGFLLTIFAWCTDPNLITTFFTPINDLVTGMRSSLFIAFLPVIIVGGALWLLWTGMVKTRTKDSIQGSVWIVSAAGVSLAFLASPMLFMNLGNDVITQGTNLFMTATTSGMYNNASNSQDMCKRTDDGSEAASKSTVCNLWKTFAYVPWAAGEFGSPAGQPIPNPTDQSTPGWSSVKGGMRFPQIDDLALRQLDAQVLDHDQMRNPVQGLKDDATAWKVAAQAVAQTQPQYFSTWSGRSGGARIGTALLALLAVLTGGLLVLVVAGYLLVLKVGFLLLVVTAPIFLLIGIHPGFGRRIAMRWLEALLGTVLKALVVSFLLAALMGIYSMVLANDNLPWLAKVMFITAFGLAAVMYRKRLVGMVGVVNLNAGGQQLADHAAGQAKRISGAGIGGAVAAGATMLHGGGLTRATLAAGKGAVYGSSGIGARSASTAYQHGKGQGENKRAQDQAAATPDADRAEQTGQRQQFAEAKQAGATKAAHFAQTQQQAKEAAAHLLNEKAFATKYHKDPSLRANPTAKARVENYSQFAQQVSDRAKTDPDFYQQLVTATRQEKQRREMLNELATAGAPR